MQPNVFVKYNFQYLNEFHRRHISDETVRNFQELYKQVLNNSDWVDFSQLLDEYGKAALVDGMHYSPHFNEFVAKRIALLIDLNHLSPFRYEKDSCTGRSF